MATQACAFIRDQNMNVPSKGSAPRNGKNASVGGRKALADLSNSTRPWTRQAAKNKHDKLSGISRDIGLCKLKSPDNGKVSAHVENSISGKSLILEALEKEHSEGNKFIDFRGDINECNPLCPAGGKTNVFSESSDSGNSSLLQAVERNLGADVGQFTQNSSENRTLYAKERAGGKKILRGKLDADFTCSVKGKVRGRKVLADISNSSSTIVPQASRMNCSKKIIAVADEQFLHDHQECINMQKGAVEKSFMLRTLGLVDDSSQVLPSTSVVKMERRSKVGSPVKNWEVMDFADLLDEVQTPGRCRKPEQVDECLRSSRCVASPMYWNDDIPPKFVLVDTPKVHK